MVSVYDFPFARLAEEAGIDILLVGDSLGMVVQGHDSTVPVTLDDIIYHAKAVRRGAPRTHVVADLPFLTYHIDTGRAIEKRAASCKRAAPIPSSWRVGRRSPSGPPPLFARVSRSWVTSD